MRSSHLIIFSKLPDETIGKWLPKCKDEDLNLALKDSGNYLKNKILCNMSDERARLIKVGIANNMESSIDAEFSAMNNLIGILRVMEMNEGIIIERFE